MTGVRSTPTSTHDVPALAVEGLRAAFGERLRAVVLFGSRARGDCHPESDWDLLVIAEGLPEATWDRYQAVKRALPPEVRSITSVLAKTPAEFEGRLPALYLDIGLDGKVLYERDAYAGTRLARVREIIGRVGLYRERTPAGDRWRWRNPPKGHWTVDWNS